MYWFRHVLLARKLKVEVDNTNFTALFFLSYGGGYTTSKTDVTNLSNYIMHEGLSLCGEV